MKDCVSLKVAKKLQKAGYKFTECGTDEFEAGIAFRENKWTKIYLLPTATQLAEELPRYDTTGVCEGIVYWEISHQDDGWIVRTYDIDNQDGHGSPIQVRAKTLPDALGLMMCYLLENKLI